jgi:hypothetical protein
LPGDKLSPSEVDSVLRRAADLDGAERARADGSGGHRGAAGTTGMAVLPGEPGGGAGAGATLADRVGHGSHEPTLSGAEVMKLGAEAGLRSDSLAVALAELRRGSLVEGPADRLTFALGSSHVVVSRVVPGSTESARRAVDQFLREQLMTIRRHHGDRIEWERAVGVWPGLLRSLDFSKRYGFSLVDRVETRVMEDGADTVVTFRIDFAKMRRQRLTAMALRSAAAFGLIGLGGAAAFPGFGAADIVALGMGGLVAAGMAGLERRRYLESRARVLLAPERFLDLYVERRRRRLDTPDRDPGSPATG